VPHRHNLSACALDYLARAGIEVRWCQWTRYVDAHAELWSSIDLPDHPAWCKYDVLTRPEFRRYRYALILDADIIVAKDVNLGKYLYATQSSTPAKIGNVRWSHSFEGETVRTAACRLSLQRRGFDLSRRESISSVLSFDLARVASPEDIFHRMIQYAFEYGHCLPSQEQPHIQLIFWHQMTEFSTPGRYMEEMELHHFASQIYVKKMAATHWFNKTAYHLRLANERVNASLGACLPQQWGSPWP